MDASHRAQAVRALRAAAAAILMAKEDDGHFAKKMLKKKMLKKKMLKKTPGGGTKKTLTPTETPDEYRDRVGRCPNGFAWDDVDEKCAEAYDVEDEVEEDDDDDEKAPATSAAGAAVPTGDEALDAQLAAMHGGGSERHYEDLQPNVIAAHSGRSIAALTPTGRRAVREYSDEDESGGNNASMGNYVVMNAFLRGDNAAAEHRAGRPVDAEVVKKRAKALSDAINATRGFPKDAHVYRGGSIPGAGALYSKMKPGDLTEAQGFWSTSATRSTAESFAGAHGTKDDSDDRIVMKIRLPKGAKALAVQEGSEVPDESEVILNHGTKLRFVAARKVGNVTEVTLDYAADGGVS